MQSSRAIFFFFLLAGLAACAPARPATLVPTSENPATATPAPSPSPTEAVTATPAPSSTPTDAATPTVDAAAATATAETENYEKIEANVKAFLEKTGEYTDEELEKRLFDLDHPHNGDLGGIFYASNVRMVQAQEVLLGGEVKGDFVYFILGTLDKQMNRFVHVGVFPVKYFQTGAAFPVCQVNSKIFHGRFDQRIRITSINEMQDLLTAQQGRGILISWFYSNQDKTEDYKDSGTDKTFYDVMNSTIQRVAGIVNRLYRAVNSYPYGTSDTGTDAGIFTIDNPMTVEDIKNLNFDPNSDAAVWGIFIQNN
jgi:hypothetical protein